MRSEWRRKREGMSDYNSWAFGSSGAEKRSRELGVGGEDDRKSFSPSDRRVERTL